VRSRRNAEPAPADYVVVGAGSAGCALAERAADLIRCKIGVFGENEKTAVESRS